MDLQLRRRCTAAGAAALTVALALGLRSATDGVFAKAAGDALYTVLLHALLVLAAPRLRPATAAGAALALSWAVEFFQLTPVPAHLAQHSTAARLILGSTFNIPDLAWYVAGAALSLMVHLGLTARRRPARA
ncbi:DUF2809 domain-containing protein [Kitasatospora sp. NPDC002227]|uniref:ribosomal maturation YjgA family protein n=1 Tax=Kitasatospora sp. NPDC002227 TaxID=3154773 RepID=UPI003319B1AC